jgi:hypothetical protein
MAVSCGIDVGRHAFHCALLDTQQRTIRWPDSPLVFETTLTWVTQAVPDRIAIDSPPGPNRGVLGSPVFQSRYGINRGRGGTNRRVAEWRLGIGGCYATPAVQEAAPAWMQAGMRLFRALSQAGYATNWGRSEAPVLEVHPTYGFRSLLTLEETDNRIRCDVAQVLRPKMPVGSLGHRQRIGLLGALLTRWGVELDTESKHRIGGSLDWTDALLAACLGALHYEGQTLVAGDDGGLEGGIHLSCIRVGLPAELEAVVHAGMAVKSVRPPEDEENSGMLLRLGAEGLGRFTQDDTLARVLDQLETEGGTVVPLGVQRISSATIQRAEREGLRVLLAHDGFAQIELHVDALRGHGKGQPSRSIVWGDREDMWEGIESPYWAFAVAIRKIDRSVSDLLFRHGREWRPGFTNCQSAWLHFRYP